MPSDIRDKAHLDHKDVLGLNFVRDSPAYFYRRYHRAGLRSHLMEVLDPADVKNEEKGVVLYGLKCFPRAEPSRILRIFRTKFKNLQEVEEELRRVKIIERYLAPHNIAKSQEFVVDYAEGSKRDPLLCGLQEYVQGAILEPWDPLDPHHLISLRLDTEILDHEAPVIADEQWIASVRKKAEKFVERLKKMIAETHHVPDLAGVGNLLLTSSGDIKLVDINNVSVVSLEATIRLDDRGYPVCDKSIEALSLLEQKLLGRSSRKKNPFYATFLDVKRMKEVRAIDEEFHRRLALGTSYVQSS